MHKLRHVSGAMPFFFAVFLNAFVDLGHKIVIQNTVFKLYDGPEQILLTAIVNGLILLPFILLISPAGFLSDRFTKPAVMRLSAWAALACTMLITLFYHLGWFIAAFAMTFLLAAQSAIYSPAKYGYIKELFGKERLGEANGVVSALSIVAILSGIFAYSILFEIGYGRGSDLNTPNQVLQAIAPLGYVLIINAVIEVWMMYRLPKSSVRDASKTFSINRYLTFRLFGEDIAPLSKSRTIRLSVVGLAVFWAVGQVMLAAFPAFFKEMTGSDNTIAVQGILACSGLGIALGSMFAGKFSKNYIETGLLPFGAMGIALGLWLLPSLESSWAYGFDFLFIGFSGGVFIVPLNALIQYCAKEHELGKTLAANNWVQNVVMLSFLVLTAIFSYYDLGSKTLLYLIALVALVGSAYVIYQLPQSLTRFALSYLLSRRYKVAVQGMKNIPSQGGVLLLGNHVSWIDWAILQIASPRPVRFVMIRYIYERWYLKWFFDMFGCIPIESGPRSRKALDTVAESLNAGDVVCLFPEGTISRTGHLAEFRHGYERACQNVNDDVVIVPFYLRGLWGSQFSRSSVRLKTTTHSIMGRDIIVAFGQAIDKNTKADVLKRRVLDLSITSWQSYIDSLPSISEMWIRSAKRTGRAPAIMDNNTHTTLSGLRALASSLMLSRRIKSDSQNVGVLLPTSAGGALCNMAVLLAGKTIVNINYTASVSAIQSALQQANITTVYSSTRFITRLKAKGFDIEEALAAANVIDLEDVSKSIGLIEKTVTLLTCFCLPSFILKRGCRGKAQASDVATILFSSGSEGEPKGVQITHRNILANVKQIADVLNMEDDDAIMANLPLFHAFGLTVTQFLPLLESCPMICHPDPTDAAGCAKAIAKYKATIMCGTSTFLRLYCRNKKVHPLMLESLRVVVAGAEKLSEDVRTGFQLKFNKPIFEGYGATETTPVASVNLPDKLETQTFKVQLGHKLGSVGMPLPGSSCMIVDPNTLEELPTSEQGMILIGGAQVMQGYLNAQEKTDKVIEQINGMRWYITGDKGYIDSDGFLFIVDRYSRFAKIGGEMVSLGSVEQAIANVLNDPEKSVIVIALPDDKKGEKLVALHDCELDKDTLKKELQNAGVNPLSIPSVWFKVEALPKLGSGKTNFVEAKNLALTLVAPT